MINTLRLTEEFAALVAIDSPSFGEKAMGAYLRNALSELGLTVTEDGAGADYPDGSGNIQGFLDGDERLGAPLLLCAHMDTVEPSRGKHAIVHEDGRITSDGTTVLGADDASGIAVILEALRVLRENGQPHRPLEVLFTIAEEVYCCGASRFDFNQLRSKEAYVLDLSGPIGLAANSAPSILLFTAAIRGQSAHAGFEPGKGVHAIAAAASAISALKLGQVDSDTTVNVGIISGGRATNIVPDFCEVRGEVRSFSHKKAQAQMDAVRLQFLHSAQAVGASVEFQMSVGCTAYQTPPDSSVVQRFQLACNKLRLPALLQKTFGGSDNNYLSMNGITGLVVASGMHNCHTCQEYTTVSELAQAAELVVTLILSNDGGTV